MPVQLERRIRLPPDARSAHRARRMVQDALAGLGDGLGGDLTDTAVLLASELAENAVLHAGTEFEVAVTVDPDTLTVSVTDHGSGPLEVHLAQPRRRYGRAATHGRGLELMQRLATRWGTRHESDGRHVTWFAIDRDPLAVAAPPEPLAPPDPDRIWSDAEQARWLLHVPQALAHQLQPAELVAELVRRLRELLAADTITVEIDDGDGAGTKEIARDGVAALPLDAAVATVVEVPLPVTQPLRGYLRVVHSTGTAPTADRTRDISELIAHRIAMAVESEWLRGVDQRRRAWMTYLAETSELLGQSLDVDLTVAVVPQVVVPRLGSWCAVHLLDASGRLQLAALTHADENALPELRAVLDPDARPGMPAQLRSDLAAVMREDVAAVRFAAPADGLAVALRARGRSLGTLTIGRPEGRAHTPEDVVLAGDIARRAALAIHNAQSTAAHVAVSQALQEALLPRALPDAPGLDFASAYLPASSGSDVGGDFYDVFTIDESHWLVSIGDVCGKGAAAAARTGLVRDVLRVLVRDDRPLTRAVEMLNDVMMEAADPQQFCTLAAARVSRRVPGAGLDVELVLAGHLQPVVLHPDGAAELIGRFGTAVGLVPTVALELTHHHLAPGDTLLVYTDGVTERRRGRDQFGNDRLLEAVSNAAGSNAAGSNAAGSNAAGPTPAGASAAQVVAAVREAVEQFSTDPIGDDIALLAVRATR